MFGWFGGASPLLFWDGSSTFVSGFPLFSFENLRPGLEPVVGQKVARLLGRFGGTGSPLHLYPATFRSEEATSRTERPAT